MANYYKLHYSNMHRDKEGGYNCYVDFIKVDKLGKRNKEVAVDLKDAVIYSYVVAMEDDRSMPRPSYLISDKDTVEEIKEDFKILGEHILQSLKEFVEKDKKLLDNSK